jgi:pyrroline-5-carboxylate reductase
MANNKLKILFIGCGNMGKAILEAFIASDANLEYHVLDHNISDIESIQTYQNFDEIEINPDIILIAVKPQSLIEISQSLKKLTNTKTLIISILAGTSIKTIADIVGNDRKIIRVMPNIAAKNKNSTSSCFFNNNIPNDEKSFIISLIKKFGICTVIESEEDMHISTIINGGAIAYFALIIKYIKESALTHAKSISEQDMKELIYNTYKNLLELNLDEDEIISKICSKAGTTEAVIKELKKQELDKIIKNAIKSGVERSKEIEKNN